MNDTILERLVPATDVLERLAQEYDRRNLFANWDCCKQAAIEAILPRLLHGQTIAWATACAIDCDDPRPGRNGELVHAMDFLSMREPGEIPLEFWCNFSNCSPAARAFDWVTGDFSFAFTDDEFRYRTGHAFGVYFDRRSLPAITLGDFTTASSFPALTAREVERNKGGAPAKYEWERAVAAVVFLWAEQGSWQPTSQAEVKAKLADWFAEREQHPSDSLLKERARWLYAEFQRRNEEAENLAA